MLNTLQLIHHFRSPYKSRTLTVRLKTQHCTSKARDMPPTLDSNTSAEVVKGPPALASKHSLTLQTEPRWRIHHTFLSVCARCKLHTSPVSVCCPYICAVPVFPWQPAAVSLFVCPWCWERTHTNAGAGIRTEGGWTPRSTRAIHLISRANDAHGSPTCSHLSSNKCRLMVLVCLRGEKRETCLICELSVLREWLNC